jgi:hypothetical protein
MGESRDEPLILERTTPIGSRRPQPVKHRLRASEYRAGVP